MADQAGGRWEPGPQLVIVRPAGPRKVIFEAGPHTYLRAWMSGSPSYLKI